MSIVKYINLDKLIERYPEQVDLIKEHYLLLLSELTVTSLIETPLFLSNIERIIKSNGTIVVGYIGNLIDNSFEIVASGTLLIEPKIIRGGMCVGHIEDIVVTKIMRKQGLSQKILDILKRIARENNCYKVILNCDNSVKSVYLKNGFTEKGVQMVEFFHSE